MQPHNDCLGSGWNARTTQNTFPLSLSVPRREKNAVQPCWSTQREIAVAVVVTLPEAVVLAPAACANKRSERR